MIKTPRRVLIVKPSALGDCVHTLPFLRRVRRLWPGAHLAWAVARPFAGLLEGHPDLDEVIAFDKRRAGLLDLRRRLAETPFDTAIDLQGLLRSGLITLASGAGTRVGFGYAREAATFCYTHRHGTTQPPTRHAVDRYLDLADRLGCPSGPAEFHFHVPDADRAAAAAMLPDGPFAVLLPGTNWATKRWPAAYFAELAGRLPVPVVVCGAAGDGELARQVGGTDLTGRTSIPQLVEVLRRAAVVVANDSGPMHIAAALGTPLVVPFGPTDPVRTGPYGRPDTVMRVDIACAPCLKRTCVHHTCMAALSVDAVERRVLGLIS